MTMQAFRDDVVSLIHEATGLPPDEIRQGLAPPPDPGLGDVGFPCFPLARSLRKAPAAIAADLAQRIAGKLAAHPGLARVSAAGPYLNFAFDDEVLARVTLSEILRQGEGYGTSREGEGRTIVIDFSSPNIAKPFGIGHLRSTVIGNAIRNLYRALGYTCVGINHLGDWGKQFGMLAVAFRRRLPASEASLREAERRGEAILYLLDLYVEIHRLADEDPAIHDQARAWFRSLEEGDPEARTLWQWFRDLSMAEFQRVYDLLGIGFEYVRGESFYVENGYVDRVVRELRAARRPDGSPLLVQSRDAWIVDLEEHGMTPCLILKADGSTLYATRDIAAILQRYDEFHPARIVYVVGAPQTLHFRQVFLVLEKMGYTWAPAVCVHVPFGLITFREGVMSTRKGNVILLTDVLNRSIEKVREIVEGRSEYTPEEKEIIARQVGIGAVIFADLSSGRLKDWDFDWDELLNFDGRTGPYLQYTHARLASILRRYDRPLTADVDFSLLEDPESRQVVRTLAAYPGVVAEAAREFEPSIVSRYLLDLAEALNRFYNVRRVLDETDPSTTAARVLLVNGVRQVLGNGLRLLGIAAPERM